MPKTTEVGSSALTKLQATLLQVESRQRLPEVQGVLATSYETMCRTGEVYRKVKIEFDEDVPKARSRLNQAKDEEAELENHIKTLVMFKRDMTPEEWQEAEASVDQVRRELKAVREDVETFVRDVTERLALARTEQRAAVEAYEKSQAECTRLNGHVDLDIDQAARIIEQSVSENPAEHLRYLHREINNTKIDNLAKIHLHHLLNVWLGTFRLIQDQMEGDDYEMTPEDTGRLQTVFNTLKDISRTYTPGHLLAFKWDFKADWGKYVKEAKAAYARVRATRH